MEIGLKNRMQNILECGVWGTIGPYSVEGAAKLAAYTGASYGLLTTEWTTGYESVLRALEIAHGDAILVPAYSSPQLSLVAVCAGAEPIFCGSGEPDEVLTAELVEEAWNKTEKPVKAVAADYIPGASPDLSLLSQVCRGHRIPLILTAHGFLSSRENGKPLAEFADAVIYSLGEGSEADCGGGGFIAANSIDLYSGAFACHNCGRSFGEGCTLDCDKLIGGDARITEWNAGQVEFAIASPVKASLPVRCRMPDQPVFLSDYYKKMIG